MSFTLDTSGAVHVGSPFIGRDPDSLTPDRPVMVGGPVRWGHLSPFTQGYIEALFADEGGALALLLERYAYEGVRVRFDDLAPETLARIIADCYRRENDRGRKYRHDGAAFWSSRQRGNAREFPPLTVQLGDDGKVRFAPQARSPEI